MKYNQKFNDLQDKLVSTYGTAKTIEGEVVRAVGKLAYEYLNNGFCNNVTGPVNYLMEISKNKYPAFYPLTKELKLIKQYSTGEYYPVRSNKKVENALMSLIDQCVTEFYGNEAKDKNTEDMWDYQEPEVYYDDMDEDY